MNVLITGSQGFIGKKLIAYLSAHKPEVNHYDWQRSFGKLNVKNFRLQFGSSIAIGKVVHLAGSNRVIESWDFPHKYLIENPELTLDALEYCRETKADFVFISSYLYGNTPNMPINESVQVQLINPYSFGKYASENLCKFYSDNFNLKITILRPFNIYGPGQNNNFLLPKIALQIKDNARNEISVDNLLTKRDFVYIDDFCEAISLTLYKYYAFEIFNIGSGFSISVEDIIKKLLHITGRHKRIDSTEQYRKNEIMDVVADASKAAGFLNWRARTPLSEGLKSLYDSL